MQAALAAHVLPAATHPWLDRHRVCIAPLAKLKQEVGSFTAMLAKLAISIQALEVVRVGLVHLGV